MKAYIFVITLFLSLSLAQAQSFSAMYAQSTVSIAKVFSKPYALNMPEVHESIMKEGIRRNLSSYETEVSVSILVSKDGNYQYHQIRESISAEKKMILSDLLPELIFVPAKLKGQNVEAWVTVKVKV
ncbi:MAG: hypothetical protein AAFR66_04165 [Bacteroidota bacterium]